MFEMIRNLRFRNHPVKVPKKDKFVTVRFQPNDKILLDSIAARTGHSRSHIIRRIFQNFCEEMQLEVETNGQEESTNNI